MPIRDVVDLEADMGFYGRATKIRSRAGFTLVEILVVMAIISILVSLVGGNFITSRVRARDAERKNSLVQVSKSIELYYNDYEQYPVADQGRVAGVAWGEALVDDEGTVYMKQLPSDGRAPLTQYFYETDADQRKYRLYARLENTEDLDTDWDGDGVAGDEFDGSIGDGSSKTCGQELCNYVIFSPNTTPEESW